jgi:hypothetical protein
MHQPRLDPESVRGDRERLHEEVIADYAVVPYTI